MQKDVETDLVSLTETLDWLVKDYSKMTRQEKVDVGAKIRAAKKVIETLDGNLSDDLKKHLKGKSGVVRGETFIATVAINPVTRLDQKLLKEKEPATHVKYCKTTDEARITYGPR